MPNPSAITPSVTHSDPLYWNAQWENRKTGWDIGYPAPAITQYMDQYTNKDAAILIPGCGNAYEAEYLVSNGFTNVTLVDIAPKAVELLQQKFQFTPQIQVLCEDFFIHQGSYDIIIEQTFFCAIPIIKRNDYARHMYELLQPNGRLIGLLFNRCFQQQGPPYSGSITGYQSLFSPYFHILAMEIAHNSIPPRAGSEVFINLLKKEF
jgi:SAM-dependent methyltransferase